MKHFIDFLQNTAYVQTSEKKQIHTQSLTRTTHAHMHTYIDYKATINY